MRGSRRSPGDRDGRKRLRWGFVALVGASGGLVALQGDASLPVVGLATLAGALVGGALLWYLTRILR